jgi:hypothetical protein
MEMSFHATGDDHELKLARFNTSASGDDYFYFCELSSLQVLRLLPVDTKIEVAHFFPDHDLILRKADNIKASKTVGEFLNIALPLVQHGSFRCKDITIVIDDEITLESHDDGEIHLVSPHKAKVRNLVMKILRQQGFDPELTSQLITQPDLYHKIEKPKRIVASYSSFEDAIESI